MAKPRSIAKTALLVVGEGAADQAFINHMKALFCCRTGGIKVKVEAGDGGSAGNVITHAIRSYKGIAYDRRLLVLDSDLPPSPADEKKARQAGYEIILWEPQCLEGTLLDVLQERVNAHESSQDLKQRLHPRLDGPSTNPKAYATLFTQAVLEAALNGPVARIRGMLVTKYQEPALYT